MKSEHILVGLSWAIFSLAAYFYSPEGFAIERYSQVQNLVFYGLVVYLLYGFRRKMKWAAFHQTLLYTFWFFVFSSFAQLIIVFVLYNLVDPGLIDYKIRSEYDGEIAELKLMNAVLDVDVDKIRERIQARYSLSSLAFTFVIQCVVSFFISVILAVIFRKEQAS